MKLLIVILAIALVALSSLFETWIIMFLAGLFEIEISFKLVYFIVLVFNLFFNHGSSN